MDGPNPEEEDLAPDVTGTTGHDDGEVLQAKDGTDRQAGTGIGSSSEAGAGNSSSSGSGAGIGSRSGSGMGHDSATGEAATKFLQSMALWVEGAGDPNRDEGDAPLSGWSARYAANFDRQEEPLGLDLAPILGLPEGTPKEELFKVANEQEEDLIKQLIS